MSLRIRNNLERADWEFIREVCCLTGNQGRPIDRARWPFFSEQWIGPYEKLRPEWSYLAEETTPSGDWGLPPNRVGYLTGCSDTTRFQRERRWLFDLPLYVRARLGAFTETGDRARFLSRFTGADRGPEESFPTAATRDIRADYPAHLHMNLGKEARGKGVGRLLVDRFRKDLAETGVHGIHLYCGPNPLPFYVRVGFRELDRVEFRPGVIVYRLGSRF